MRYTKALKMLSMVGQCYKKDYLVATHEDSGHQAKYLRDQIKKGYILERDIIVPSRDGNKTVSVVAITHRGRVVASDLEHSDYYCSIEKYVHSNFATGVPIEMHRSLVASKLLLLMHSSKIKAFMNEKPMLSELFREKNGNAASVSSLPQQKFYENEMGLNEALSNGVYYTIKEFREYLTSKGNNANDADITFGKVKGIYIDKEKTCAVYYADAFEDKITAFKTSVEIRTLNAIAQRFDQLNGVNELNVIVITNGKALITDMGIAGKHGHTPHDEVREMNIALQWVDKNTTTFNKVYVFQNNHTGFEQLEYFSHHTYEEWQNDSYELAKKLEGFTPIPRDKNTSGFLFGRDNTTGTRTVFIPFYELKFLEQVRKFHEDVSIITCESMGETIAHILRKPNTIYDIEGNRLDTKVYQQNGYAEGVTPPEKKKAPRRKHYPHRLGVELDEDEYKMVKRICNQRGMSMAHFARLNLVPIIKAEYSKYEEYFKLEDERRDLLIEAQSTKLYPFPKK